LPQTKTHINVHSHTKNQQQEKGVNVFPFGGFQLIGTFFFFFFVACMVFWSVFSLLLVVLSFGFVVHAPTVNQMQWLGGQKVFSYTNVVKLLFMRRASRFFSSVDCMPHC
jgi:hypothetical protein